MIRWTKTLLMHINYFNQNTTNTKKAKMGELRIELVPYPKNSSYSMRIHTGDNEFIDVDPEWMKAACEKIQAIGEI